MLPLEPVPDEELEARVLEVVDAEVELLVIPVVAPVPEVVPVLAVVEPVEAKLPEEVDVVEVADEVGETAPVEVTAEEPVGCPPTLVVELQAMRTIGRSPRRPAFMGTSPLPLGCPSPSRSPKLFEAHCDFPRSRAAASAACAPEG